MIITEIQEINKKKCRVYVDGRKAFILYKGEIRKLCLKENEEITNEIYSHIMNDILLKRGRARALHLLEKQERTRGQLIEKLKKSEYPDEIVEDAVAYVESYHYIDDERYARQYIICSCKKKSKRQIFYALQQRGLDREIIQKVYDEVSLEIDLDDEEGVLIDKLIAKKTGGLSEITQKDVQKIYRYLITKGFSYDKVNRHMEDLGLNTTI